MRIKQYSDQAQPRIGGGIPRLAKLKKGAPKSASGFGADLDYFRVAFEEPYNSDPANLETWVQLYGEKPTEFQNVFLLGRSAEEVFSSAYEDYGAGQLLKTRCDGETIVRAYNPQTARHDDTPRPCQCDPNNRKCGRIARLNFIPGDFIRATGLFGYFTLETKSIYDIIELGGIVDEIFAARGSLNGVPFVLGRGIQKGKSARYIDKSGQPKRKQSDMNLVYLYPARQFVAEQLLSAMTTDAPSLTAGSGGPALPAPSAPPTYWTPDRLQKLDEWARSGLDMTADELLLRLGTDSWNVFPDSAAVKTAVRAKGLSVVVREIGVTPDKEIDLLTSLGSIRLEYGLVQLEDLLKAHAERFTAVHKPDTWQAGKKYPIEPLRLSWVDKAGMIDPRRLEPLDSEVAEFEEVERDET